MLSIPFFAFRKATTDEDEVTALDGPGLRAFVFERGDGLGAGRASDIWPVRLQNCYAFIVDIANSK